MDVPVNPSRPSLRGVYAFPANKLLVSVLHLCLAKKQPVWLVHNSQLVMLEPYICRLQTTVVQELRMSCGQCV